VAGLVTTFGAGAMTNSIEEIGQADMLFVIGSNTTEAHPVIAMEMKRAKLAGATLVVADPRAIWLAGFADKHLMLNPGTDVWLLNAMANVIVTEGLLDQDFIDANTEEFESVREAVLRYSPEEAEKVTGVSAEDIRWVARKYATTEKAGIYYTLGITEHTHGTDNVYALANLVLMTGHLGKPSAGMNPLRGQNNVQGANDSGATPVFLPGYQWVVDDEARHKFDEAWGVTMPDKPGLNLNEMMKEVGTGIRGMFVMGEDIVLSEPDACTLERHMDDLDFVVVQDIFMTGTARWADVVFPAACFAEKDGVFTNSERRVQRVRKAVDAPGEARADWRILTDLANAVMAQRDAPGATWTYEDPAEVYAEMAALSPQFAGISHARLDAGGGLQWPCPDADHPGTKYLHEGGVLRGKGLFQAVDYRPSAELPDDTYPLSLSTGRTLYHYNADTQTKRDPGLDEKQPEAFIEIHPRDAEARGIEDGEVVEVVTRRGKVRLLALYSVQVRQGCIWMPFHFVSARANVLTLSDGDEVTGTAEYKVCAAQVRRPQRKDRRKGRPFPGSFLRTGAR
jgi:formate dehydrogenase major subunit/formate dehydrogenase alpha subunit